MTKRDKKVTLEIKGHEAWIVLHDARGLNAMGMGFMEDLDIALKELESQINKLKAVVIKTDVQNFSVGLDIKECAGKSSQEIAKTAKFASSLFNRFAEIPIPTLALYRGHTIGGAIELTLGADFRYALNDSKLSLPAPKIGFFNPGSVCYHLPKLIGMSRAKELLLSTGTIDAQTAYRWGLIQEVMNNPEDLQKLAEKWCEVMCSLDTQALKSTKKLLALGCELNFHPYIEKEYKELDACFLREEPLIRMKNFWNK